MEIGQIVYANSRIQFGEQNSPVGASCKFFKLVIGGLTRRIVFVGPTNFLAKIAI